MGWQDDPVVGGAPSGGGGWQSDPVVGGAKAAPAQTSSGNPITNAALAFADAYAGGLGRHNPFMAMPQGFESDIQQAHQNLGMANIPLSIAAYALGPGKVLGPEGMTASLAGRPITQGMAEGALAGAYSDFDPSNPGAIARGALGGTVLGGTAGGIAKGVGKLAGPAAPTIDPAQEVARTEGIKTAAYGALTKVPANPTSIDNVLGGVMNNLDPSVETGMSSGLRSTINNIRGTVQGLDEANMGQVDSWQRQINEAARREAHPTDAIVAGQINSGLDGLIKGGGAGDLQDAAQAAHQNYAVAQKLQDWQTRIKAGGSVGQAPLTEAENFFRDQPDKQAALTDLYQQSQNPMSKLSWGLGHLGSTIAGFGGEAIGGFPAAIAAEAAWLLKGKPMLQNALKGYDKNQLLKAYQAKYPTLTGATPPPTQAPNPAMGDLIKNLMIGGVY